MHLLYIIFIKTIVSHSNLFMPKPRGNLKWWGYCSRGQGCNSACDAPYKESTILSPYVRNKKYVKRGEKLNVQWYRQNHPGGFVRLALTTLEQSDNLNSFETNVIKYTCYETNCSETEPNVYLGELNGRGSEICSTDIIIPDNLPNGAISLQWLWFGGGIYYGEQNTTFANYVNCSDMILEGGSPYKEHESKKPQFVGGDIANPRSNQCRYWGSNKPGECAGGSEQKEKCGYSAPINGRPYNI